MCLFSVVSRLFAALQDAETRKSFEDFKAQEAAKKKQQTCVPSRTWALMFAHGVHHAQGKPLNTAPEQADWRAVILCNPNA